MSKTATAIETFIEWLFPKKSKWVDIGCFDRSGNYYLLQMRITIKNNKKHFRQAKMGFVNDWQNKEVIFKNSIHQPNI